MSRYAVCGNILLGTRLVPGSVVIEDDIISEIHAGTRPESVPRPRYEVDVVAPGLIDLQVNGGFGVAVGQDQCAIEQLSARLPQVGVTSFLPTLVTSPPATYREVLQGARNAPHTGSARSLGLHLEGPFLCEKKAGAHPIELIRAADPAAIGDVLEPSALRMMTVAPEVPGALALIRRLVAQDVVVSLGHTNATYEEFRTAIDAGATMATHLFNAMSPFGHHEPGASGAALVDDRVTAGIIADGIHVHPAGVRLAFRAKTVHRVALVSDLMAAACMPPGTFQLGSRRVETDGTSARLRDGTLAGSLVPLAGAVRNVVQWGIATVGEAIYMASTVPARALGMHELGEIVAGNRADLVLFSSDLSVEGVIVAGQPVFRSGCASG